MTISVYACSGHAQKGKPQVEQAPTSAYRGRTMALLRRYFRMSLDIGRLPSVLNSGAGGTVAPAAASASENPPLG